MGRNLKAVKEGIRQESRKRLSQAEEPASARVPRWVLGASKGPLGIQCDRPRVGRWSHRKEMRSEIY